MSGLSMADFMLCEAFCQPIHGKTRDCGRNLQLVPVDGFLEALARGKGRDGLGVDADLLAVERAASGARLAPARQEGAEADHGDALALGDVGDDGVEHRVHRFACGRLADVARLRGDFDQVGFGHDVWHALALPVSAIVSKSNSKFNATATRAVIFLRSACKHLSLWLRREYNMDRFNRLALAAFAVGVTAASAHAQTTLTYSSWGPPTHHLTIWQANWAAHVEKATGGRVKFTGLPKAPAAPPGTFDAVRDGLVDLSYVTASYTPARHILPLMAELPGAGETAETNSVAFSRIPWTYSQQAREDGGAKLR